MSITGYIPTLEASFTFTDNSGTATKWGYQLVGYLQKNGTTNKFRYPQGRIDASTLTNGSTQTVRFPGITPGTSYDGFVALADLQGNETAQVALFTNYAVPKVASGSPVGPIWSRLHHLPVSTDPTYGTWNTGTNTFDRGAHHPSITGTIDANGDILNVAFPGGKLQSDGSLTNVNGASDVKTYHIGSGNVIAAEADIKAGSAGGTNTSEIFIGTSSSNGYFVSYTPSSGAYQIGKVASGVVTSLGGGTIGADLNVHFLKLTINVNSSNFIEGSIDTFNLSATDSAVNLGSGSAVAATVYTCGSDGSLTFWKYSLGTGHYSHLHTSVRGLINSDGSSAKTTDWLPESSTNKYAAEHGADITGNHTAADTSKVNGVASSTISQGASRANAAINSSNQVNYANTSSEYQANFDSSGNALKSTMLNSKTSSLLPFTTDFNIVVTIQGTSPNDALYYISNGTSGQAPKFYLPDGTVITAVSLGTSASPINSGVSVPSGSTGYILAYYKQNDTGGVNGTGWHVTVQTSQFTPQQIAAAYADGGLMATVASKSNNSFSGGSGGGTGSGGLNGCPEINQTIERKRGDEVAYVPAHTLREGDFLRDPVDGEWNRINAPVEIGDAEIWEATIAGESVRVDASHLFMDASDTWVNVRQLAVGQEMHVYPGGTGVVESVKPVGPGKFVHIHCDRMRYVLGRTVSHNVKPQ